MAISVSNWLWQRDSLFESANSVEDVGSQVEAGASPSLSFIFMSICSTILATLGLLANSAAVIIGAMIVAPLMAPILSMSFGIVAGNWRLALRSLLTVVIGTLLTLALSYAITELIGWRIGGSEIAARTKPTLLDLGVAVAAGAAAAFAFTRPNVSSALAGIAIAVALVPPLCTAGIAISLGKDARTETGVTLDILDPSGPFLLFLTNIVGIFLAAGIVFFVQYYRRRVLAIISLALVCVGLFVLVPPLGLSMEHLLIRNQVRRTLALHDLLPDDARFRATNLRVTIRDGTAYVTGDIVTDQKLISQELIDRSREKLEGIIKRPVVVEYALIPEIVYRSE